MSRRPTLKDEIGKKLELAAIYAEDGALITALSLTREAQLLIEELITAREKLIEENRSLDAR